ncbi:MAG TPA: amidohydrolase family protein [Actinophytocola sp.]|uniref:metal-dependent hydrolase family protein n=1 Tax=Actinophytocola sp. TaxID=1872138 RepID=UPI002DDD0381|nr:amidohydrolase family protein [Actinophytocola sp.]HEV2779399.1 amidohydrolase family protein [Actinophytocola sp.]
MGALVVRFGTLHDRPGEEPKRNGHLVIDGDRVVGVDVPAPDGAVAVEAACVVPGLVNAHAHLECDASANTVGYFAATTPTRRAITAANNARLALAAGVTSVRDLGASNRIALEVRDAIACGALPGPNVVAAGNVICMTGGHGSFVGRTVDGVDDIRRAVREQRRDGAEWIKFIATGGVLTPGAVPGTAELTQEELAAGVAEAHRLGLSAAAHAMGPTGIIAALRAGIDSIEHGHLIDAAGIELIVERGTYLVPTLSAIVCIVEAGPEVGLPAEITRKAREIAEHAGANLGRARAAGARFAGGSDAGTPFNGHDNYAREVELMHTMLGMTPREALRAATVHAADLIGLPRGTLTPGDVADLVCLDRDVDADITALRTPTAVVQAGSIVRHGSR